MTGGLVRLIMDPATTLGTLRQVPLSTGDFMKNRLVAKERQDVMNNLLLAYEHVPAADRICYFDVRAMPGAGEVRDAPPTGVRWTPNGYSMIAFGTPFDYGGTNFAIDQVLTA